MRTDPDHDATMTDSTLQARVSERTMTRRTVLRGAMLGVTGAGLAVLLAACGDENEEPATGAGAGAGGNSSDSPAGTAETGI